MMARFLRNELERGVRSVYLLAGKVKEVNALLVAPVSLWLSQTSLAVKLNRNWVSIKFIYRQLLISYSSDFIHQMCRYKCCANFPWLIQVDTNGKWKQGDDTSVRVSCKYNYKYKWQMKTRWRYKCQSVRVQISVAAQAETPPLPIFGHCWHGHRTQM